MYLLVDPKVWKEVDDHNLRDGSLVSPVSESGEGDRDTNVGPDDVPLVSSLEDDRRRREVVGTGRVVSLSRSVDSKVSGPAEKLSNEKVVACHEGRVFQSLSELFLSEFGNVDTGKLLILSSRETEFLSGLGDEDLISGQVAGSGMVSTVRDSPRVVRNQQGRVDEPSNSVVDGLGR